MTLGSPANPNGGLLSRFDVPEHQSEPVELTLPSLGVTFSGAAPSDTPWETANYIQEYDGFADFPKYPLNFLADLNAFMGIMFIHGTYPTLTDDQLASAIELPVSDDYTGNNAVLHDPHREPAVAELLRGSGFGNAIADLLQPAVCGCWSTSVTATSNTAGTRARRTWPPRSGCSRMSSAQEVFTALGSGAQQGWNDFIADLQNMSSSSATDLLGLGHRRWAPRSSPCRA